jgi:hypothetical protein
LKFRDTQHHKNNTPKKKTESAVQWTNAKRAYKIRKATAVTKAVQRDCVCERGGKYVCVVTGREGAVEEKKKLLTHRHSSRAHRSHHRHSTHPLLSFIAKLLLFRPRLYCIIIILHRREEENAPPTTTTTPSISLLYLVVELFYT